MRAHIGGFWGGCQAESRLSGGWTVEILEFENCWARAGWVLAFSSSQCGRPDLRWFLYKWKDRVVFVRF